MGDRPQAMSRFLLPDGSIRSARTRRRAGQWAENPPLGGCALSVERRWQARSYTDRQTKQTHLSLLVFHRNGRRIGDFRKVWEKALEKAGLPVGKGTRKLFHDFRRTAARDMVRAGVPQSVAMSITGHKTVSMFLRYNITDGKDQRDALQRTAELRRQRVASAPQPSKVTPLRTAQG